VKPRTARNLQRVTLYLLMAATALLFLLPVLWVFSLSLKDVRQVFQYPPRLIPEAPSWANYQFLLTRSQIPTYIWNSMKIVFMTVMGTILVATPAAYALSRFRIPRKRLVLFLILAFQMLSPMVIAIPLYRYFNQLNLINSHWGVILVYVAWQAPFATWVLKGFIDSIPIELDEAAMIDGATRWQSMLRVIMPVSLPGLTSAMIMIAINSWSQFIIPFVLIDSQALMPVSVGILNFQNTQEAIQVHLLAAASILATLPALAVFIILQRFIVRALTAGAVKG